MALLQPTNLDDYCKAHNISFFQLSLPCVFCKYNIDYVGLAQFHFKGLCLTYKDDVCYACCPKCLQLTASYELRHYYRCHVPAEYIEFVCQKPLKELTVRCLKCFKLLDNIEKFDCVTASLPFVLVRHHWRNYCRICVRQHDW